VRATASVNVARSRLFTADIRHAASAARAAPDRPVLLEADFPWDYEPVESISRFLRAYGVTNPLAVRYTRIPGARYQPFEETLQDRFDTLMREGGVTFPTFQLGPLASVLAARPSGPNGPHCFTILLSGRSAGDCTCLEVRTGLAEGRQRDSCVGPPP